MYISQLCKNVFLNFIDIYFSIVQKGISQLYRNIFLNCVEMYFSISGSYRRSGCTKHNSFPTFSSPSFSAAAPIMLDLLEVRLPDQTELTSHLFFLGRAHSCVRLLLICLFSHEKKLSLLLAFWPLRLRWVVKDTHITIRNPKLGFAFCQLVKTHLIIWD